jgi:hypothetical protein
MFASRYTYESLKSLIKNKIGKNNDIIETVSQLEKKPESEGRQLALRKEFKLLMLIKMPKYMRQQ